MTRTLVAGLAALMSLPAPAQKPTPPLPPLVRSVEVSVTNVDVVVTDGKGQRVKDLTRDDFVLKEDGAPQVITNFFSVDEGTVAVDRPAGAPDAAAGVPTPKARISVFIDNLHLTPADRTPVLRAVGDFVAGTLGPNIEASVSTWDRKLLPRGPFTSDGATLKTILSRLEEEPAEGQHALTARDQILRQIDTALLTNPRDRTRDTLIRSAIQSSRSYALEMGSRVDDTLNGLGVAVDQLSGMEGRKVLLYISERLPVVPGVELLQYLRDALGFTLQAYQRDIPSDREFDRRDKFRELARKAQAAGVALYAFDAKGLAPDATLAADRPAAFAHLNAGLEETNHVSMLQYLAEETGGAAIFSRNSFKEALGEMGRDFGTYYSLGYQSSSPAVGKLKKVVVTVRRPGLGVRARTGHVEKSPEERVGDAVVSRLWFPKVQNSLKVRLDTGQPKKKGKAYVLPLKFYLPYEKLTLVPEGDRSRGRVVFQVAALDDTGRMSPLRKEVAPIEIPGAKVEETAGKDFVFETEVELRPVGQMLSFALTDEVSRQTSYVQMPLTVTGK